MKKYCVYHIFNDNLKPFIYQLSDADFLLSNISQLSVDCNGNLTTIVPRKPQIVLELKCGCYAYSKQFLLPIHTTGCLDDQDIAFNFTPKYIINLPLLHEYFEDDVLENFQPDLLLSHDVQLFLPEINLEQKKYEHNMAIENKAKFQLDEIVNLTKK